jgi:ferric-dicitrate binding protein FerR (iron transport regulator)
MSKNGNKNLADWIDEKVGSEEITDTADKENLKSYKNILSEIDGLEPDLPNLTDRLSEVLQLKKKTKGRQPVGQAIRLAVAVFIALLLFAIAYLFLDQKMVHVTDYGETLSVTLPDESTEVTLAPKSSIEFIAGRFNQLREISLDGRILVNISERGNFKVKVHGGEVRVLGTVFEVFETSNGLNVVCFEGKVQVKYKGVIETVRKGELIRIINRKTEKQKASVDTPQWIEGMNVFEDAPLKEVLDVLRATFGVSVDVGKIDISQRYTGKFESDDLELACQMVFDSLNIDYSLNGNKIELSGKK